MIDEIMQTEPLRASPTKPVSLHEFLFGHKHVWVMMQNASGLEVCTISTWAKVLTVTDDCVTLETEEGMVILTKMAGTVNQEGTARFLDGHLTMRVI